MKIRDMVTADKENVMEMVQEFYHSDAVDHEVKQEVLEATLEAAVSEDPILRGVVLEEYGRIIGYAYLTSYFVTEAGGINLMIEDLFIKKEARGHGYGSQFFQWLFKEYPNVKRYRMEVTEENKGAISLYKKMGFEFLGYLQMIKDI
ncbi:MAG: GNAT family N-acetyltransferase [Eubacteriales bacterium]|nr:GNAT family N-acetyltransferase [Eubacteriales bacterium]